MSGIVELAMPTFMSITSKHRRFFENFNAEAKQSFASLWNGHPDRELVWKGVGGRL
jgi:hypothetical protein